MNARQTIEKKEEELKHVKVFENLRNLNQFIKKQRTKSKNGNPNATVTCLMGRKDSHNI